VSEKKDPRFLEIQASGKLPSPGAVALAVLRLTSRADATSAEIERILRGDPALTGRVLAYANSASASRGRQVASISDAVVVLGMSALRQLVLGFSLIGSRRPLPGFDYDAFWSRSIAEAACARQAAGVFKSVPADELFTCGLLAGIGRLTLASVYSERYAALAREIGTQGDEVLVRQEQAAFGTDHRELGAYLMRSWGIPGPLCEATGLALRRAPPRYGRAGGQASALTEALRLGFALADRIAPAGAGEHLHRWLAAPAAVSQAELSALAEAAREQWMSVCALVGVQRRADAPAAVSPPEVAPDGGAAEAAGITVLFAGEASDARSALAEACVVNACRMVCREAQEELLRAVVEHRPNIVVVDEPDAAGEALRAFTTLRESDLGKPLYLIALTRAERESRIRLFTAGFDECLVRPLDSEELNARLRAVCRAVRLQQEVIAERRSNRRNLAELAAFNRKLEQVALTDPLTGIANRVRFHDRLSHAVSAGRQAQRRLAVMYMDMDRFKVVNDTLGHKAGDALLREFAARIGTCLRESDTLARMGGDEFTLLALGIEADSDATELAQRIHAVLEAPFRIADKTIHVSTSVGVALFPEHGEDSDTLTRHADAAMYLGKKKGRGHTVFYSPQIGAAMERRFAVEAALKEGMRNGRLRLVYQPQIDLATKRMVGVEALARLSSAALGEVSPAEFIPVAEDSGLIMALGEWVLRTAVNQAAQWTRSAFPGLKMAVNLSARQFSDPGLAQMIRGALEAAGVAPDAVGVEVTESVLMEDMERVCATLVELGEMGMEVSLDDFGTGYSSLGYLKKLPISCIKIDRSFTSAIPGDKFGSELVQSVIGMAGRMGLKVVAEGVETRAQLEFLREAGCKVAQGYLFARPLPPDQLEALARERRNTGAAQAPHAAAA
jgi:diguanylate cyclase (GGDEF)-like protein